MLSFTMGICAIFDVTGARVFQLARGSLPEAPPPGSRPDPFLAAMETIMAARREVAPLSTAAGGAGQAPAAEGAGQALAAEASAEGADQAPASAAAEGAVAATAQKIGVTLPA